MGNCNNFFVLFEEARVKKVFSRFLVLFLDEFLLYDCVCVMNYVIDF